MCSYWKKSYAVVIGLGLLLLGQLAYAGFKVYSPTVEPGEFELEVRGDNTFDNDPAKNAQPEYRLEAGYGIAPRWFTTLGTTYARNTAGTLESEEIYWENIIQLTAQGEHWLDAGLYLEYAAPQDNGEPDELEGKVLLEKSVGRYLNTVNLIFVRHVGRDADNATEFEYAWRTSYYHSKAIQPGIELYGAMGELGHVLPASEQDHRAGPVLSGLLGRSDEGKWRYELGYLFGLSDAAPSGTLKFGLEYEFR
ncbi:MAG: hypothetical protein P8Z75_06545 [Gammaproteobacteria bacterium]